MWFLDTSGEDTNGSPRGQSTPVPASTTATLPSPENVPLSNNGFSDGPDLLTRMYTTRRTIELAPNAHAGALFAGHSETGRRITATIPRAPQLMTPRNDIPQLLSLLRNQSAPLAPAFNPVVPDAEIISTIHPVIHRGMPMGGVPRAPTNDAYLIQLMQQRNAAALASMESRSRLLQLQLVESALYTRPELQRVALPLPADINTLVQVPTRRETFSETIINANTIPLSLPVCLSRPADEWKLTEYQRFLRKQIQVFAASFEDADTYMRGRNNTVTVGQVGIRCRHCAPVPVRFRRRGSAYFPSKKYGIYQAAQNMATSHFPVCAEVPPPVLQELQYLRVMSTAGAGRQYWFDSATELGLVDTEDAGIRFLGDDIGMPRASAAVLQR